MKEKPEPRELTESERKKIETIATAISQGVEELTSLMAEARN